MRKAMLLLAVLGLAGTLWAADPFVGTWKLNAAKSRFDPPSSAIKSHIVKIEAQDNGLKFISDLVDVEGKAIHTEDAPKFDGKDYPIKGDPNADMVSIKRIGTDGFERLNKKGGKEASRVKVVFSKNGKSSTVTTITKDAKGQEYTSSSSYEKQ